MNFGTALINIQNAWSSITGSINNKSLSTQYEEDTDKYSIFALDGNIVYTSVIYKGTVPDIFLTDQATNDANKADFEANYKPFANRRTQLVTLISGSVSGTFTVVSGTVGLDRGNSFANPLFISGSITATPPAIQKVWDGGTQGVSGSVSTYTQGAQLVSGTVGITSSVNVYTGGPQAVSGSVSVYTQGAQAVSGSQLTGSTFGGFPVVVGGQDGTFVRALKTATDGTLFITGSLSVTPPLVTNVSGAVSVYTQGPQAVTGSVSVFTQGPQSVSGSVATFTQGPQLVSGTLAVSGTQLTGSTFGGFPVVVGGQDGTFVRALKTAPDGALLVQQTGSVKVFDTGIQAVSGAVSTYTQGPQAVSGSVSVFTQGPQAVTGTVGTFTQGPQLVSGVLAVSGTQLTGSTFGGFPVVVGGQDGTFVRALKTAPDGALFIQLTGSVRVFDTGTTAVSGAVSVYTQGSQAVSGSVSTYTQGPQLVSGTLAVSGTQLTGSTFGGFPVVAGGVDASGFVRGVRTDAVGAVSIFASSSLPVTGSTTVQGQAASGSAAVGNPVYIAGIDPTGFVRPPLVEQDGTFQVRDREETTFIAWVTGSQIGNNKSMLSILNAAGSPVVIRVREVWLMSTQEAAVTGVNSQFELRRMKNHSGGTSIASGSIETMDLADSLNSNVSIRTGATTITTESSVVLWKAKWSSDEWGTGTTEDEDNDHALQQMLPLFARRDPSMKPLTLRGGDGMTVKHTVNSTQGTFDLAIVFTQRDR